MGNSQAKIKISLSNDLVFDSTAFKNSEAIIAERNHSLRGKYIAGRRLYGIAYIELKECINATSFDLKISGDETAQIESGENTRKDTNNFFELKIPLITHVAYGLMQPGRYQYQFEAMIPAYLPGTMEESSSNEFCRIKYTITAHIHGSGVIYDYKNSRPLFLLPAPRPREHVPRVLSPCTKQVNYCFCSKKGSIILGASVSNTHLRKGDVFVVGTGCVNESMLDVEYIEIKLIQNVKWRARISSTNKRCILVQTKIQDHNAAEDGGLLYGDKYSEVFRRMNDALLNQQTQLTVPNYAIDTYCGKLITVEHYLEVKVKTEGYCTTDPVISTPFVITSSSPAVKPKGTAAVSAAQTETHIYNPNEEKIPLVSSNIVSSPPYNAQEAPQINNLNIWENVPIAQPIQVGRMDDDNTYTLAARATIVQQQTLPSAEILLKDQKHQDNYDHKVFFENRLKDPVWAPVISSLTPSQFGTIIRNVVNDFDQPKVALFVASVINDGNFTSKYCVQGIKGATEYNRITIAKKLLPLCTDLTIGGGADEIKAALTDWEKVVLATDFRNYIQS